MRVYSRRRERRFMRQLLAYWRTRFHISPYLAGAFFLGVFMLAFTFTGRVRSWV